MTTYRVILEGTTLPGFDPAVARTRLASLVKKDEDVAGQLLSGQPRTIKSSVDQATGIRYVNALTKIGVACRIEAEVLKIDLGSSAAPTASTEVEKKGVDEKF
jgi:hypothetical protein